MRSSHRRVDRAGCVEFPIPMRGNEKQLAVAKGIKPVGKFPIPMRGNEIMALSDAGWAERLGFRSP